MYVFSIFSQLVWLVYLFRLLQGLSRKFWIVPLVDFHYVLGLQHSLLLISMFLLFLFISYPLWMYFGGTLFFSFIYRFFCISVSYIRQLIISVHVSCQCLLCYLFFCLHYLVEVLVFSFSSFLFSIILSSSFILSLKIRYFIWLIFSLICIIPIFILKCLHLLFIFYLITSDFFLFPQLSFVISPGIHCPFLLFSMSILHIPGH